MTATAQANTPAETAAAIGRIVAGLQDAWNAADGPGFAAAFAPDADFVHRYGGRAQGRPVIAAMHDALLSGPYKGSVVRYDVESVRSIAPTVALAHVRAHLSVPTQKLELDALWTGVFVRDEGSWSIAAFHNTLVEPVPH